jgi:hypothetical protein
MSLRTGALLLGMLLTTASCTDTRETLSGAELIARAPGCYRLVRAGNWPGSSFADIEERFATFRLSSASLSPKHPELHPVDGMRPLASDSLSWRLRIWSVNETADTVRVNISHGFGGVGLAMTSRRDSTEWQARVLVFGDVGPPFEHYLGMGRVLPIACSDTGKSLAPVA